MPITSSWPPVKDADANDRSTETVAFHGHEPPPYETSCDDHLCSDEITNIHSFFPFHPSRTDQNQVGCSTSRHRSSDVLRSNLFYLVRSGNLWPSPFVPTVFKHSTYTMQGRYLSHAEQYRAFSIQKKNDHDRILAAVTPGAISTSPTTQTNELFFCRYLGANIEGPKTWSGTRRYPLPQRHDGAAKHKWVVKVCMDMIITSAWISHKIQSASSPHGYAVWYGGDLPEMSTSFPAERLEAWMLKMKWVCGMGN